MTIRTSNAKYLTILDPLPRERVGWWVEVYDADNLNTVLARVFHFKSLSFNTPESDIGFGTVTWDYGDPLLSRPLPNGASLTDLLQRPNYWRVFDNGVERFRFLHDGLVRKVVDENGDQELSISGPDPATFLEWATVLPSAYPADFAATPRTFTGVPWATVWLTLLNEAKARGVVPSWIAPTFSATLDSNGDPWGDSGTYAIPPGGNLLDLLRQMADTSGFKWQMRYTGALIAAPEFGRNLASTVRFFEGHDVLVSGIQEERKDVRNDVYLQGGDGLISRAVDTDSVVQWFRREAFVTVQEAQDASTRNTAVNTQLATTKQPVTAFTFQVDPFPVNAAGESIGRRVFVDYTLGDTIGYGPRATDGSQDYRLVDLAIEVGEDSQVTLEITVQSRLERSIDRMRRLLKLALGGNYNASSGGSGVTAQVMGSIAAKLQDLYLDDLADVTTASAANGDALLYDLGTGQWKPGVPPGAAPNPVKDRLWFPKAGAVYADEFNDGSLAAGFVKVDPSGKSAYCTWTEEGDTLSVEHTANADATGQMHALLIPIGGAWAAGDAIQTAMNINAQWAVNYAMGGPCLTNGTTHGTSNMIAGFAYMDNVGGSTHARAFAGMNADTTQATNVAAMMGGGYVHVRLVMTATNTWRCDTSRDGSKWRIGNTVSYTITPTHMGLLASNWIYAIPFVIHYEYLRRYSGVT